MVVLGISAYYHDSAAALIVDGKVTAAICEERLSRTKHDKSFPKRAIAFCVEYSGITYTDIDYVVFYEKPLRKFERILTTHIFHAPNGFKTFVKAMPIWLKERLDMKSTITKSLNELCHHRIKWDIRFVEHHLSHTAMAYFTSPFENAAVLVVDAVGENATTSLFKAIDCKIECIKQQSFPNSVGLLYSAFTYYLGSAELISSHRQRVADVNPHSDDNDEKPPDFG